MEPVFGTLVACKPAITSAFWDHWETAVLGQILAKSLLEPDFGTLVAWSPATKSAFWDHWKKAVLGQILVRSLLEQYFGTLVQAGHQSPKIWLQKAPGQDLFPNDPRDPRSGF